MSRTNLLLIALLVSLPTSSFADRGNTPSRKTVTPALEKELPPDLQTKKAHEVITKHSLSVQDPAFIKPDLTIAVAHPPNSQAPAVVKVTNLGTKPNAAVHVKVDLEQTCDGKFTGTVPIDPGHQGGYIITSFNTSSEKTFDIIPDDGNEWKPTPGCTYSLRARVDPDDEIAEVIETNNEDTAYFAGN